ncbi:unnamed protein product [Meganyctiphanes norvegica]|uniref:Uncharacterized protein n=1 Tax=Meganyctiphanes norvegica TaxID=48144 RepID=A0AAV2QV11_MEGNR
MAAPHMLVIVLVLSISIICESRPQSNSIADEDAEFNNPPVKKAPTELFFGPVGGFVGEVQVSTGSLTVSKKPRRRPSNGPRASALISDDSFSNFQSFDDSPAVAAPVAVAAGPGLSISSGGPVLSFNKPAEVVPAERR